MGRLRQKKTTFPFERTKLIVFHVTTSRRNPGQGELYLFFISSMWSFCYDERGHIELACTLKVGQSNYFPS